MYLKLLKSFFSHFDFFGVDYSFYYKNKQKYFSATGGIAFLIFFFVSLIYILLNINSLIKRTSMSIIYYDTPISETDSFSFDNYSIALSFGVTCGSYNEKINPTLHDDLFFLEFKYTKLTKEKGLKIKHKIDIPIKLCNHSNFYNEFNQSFDSLGLSKLYCPDFTNESIHGIYSDEDFSYYEIGVRSRKTHMSDYIYLFTNYDCKLMLYYLNVGTNIYDYKKPITKAVDLQFIQLSPIEYNKLNVYFQLIKFSSDEKYFFESYKTKYYVDYSRNELYNVYVGPDRFELKGNDYDNFAKIFLRADTQRKLVSRRYLKFYEFIANMYSLIKAVQFLISVFVIELNIFYSHQSVIKKIFYIKDSFNNNQMPKNFDLILDNYKNKYYEDKNNKINNEKINHDGSSQFLQKQSNNLVLENNFINSPNKKLLTTNPIKHNKINLFDLNINQKNINKYTNNNNLIDNSIYYTNKNQNNGIVSIEKQNDSFLTKKATLFIKNKIEKFKLMKNKKNVNFDFNLIELIIIFLCPLLTWKKLKYKNNLLKIAKKKFIYNFDIITFFKNMQMVELMNYILLDKYQFVMFKFLSKPFISLNNKFDLFDNIVKSYKNDFSEDDVNQFKKGYRFLFKKDNKNEQEKKIFSLVTMEIDNIINKNV